MENDNLNNSIFIVCVSFLFYFIQFPLMIFMLFFPKHYFSLSPPPKLYFSAKCKHTTMSHCREIFPRGICIFFFFFIFLAENGSFIFTDIISDSIIHFVWCDFFFFCFLYQIFLYFCVNGEKERE